MFKKFKQVFIFLSLMMEQMAHSYLVEFQYFDKIMIKLKTTNDTLHTNRLITERSNQQVYFSMFC